MTALATEMTTSKIHSRPLRDDADWWRVRDLLIETYPITPTDFNWEIRRWDGKRFHNADISWNPDWEKQYHLWETDDGRLVGAVHPEYTGSAYLELHPDYRHLIELEMIAWAEDNLVAPVEDTSSNKRRLEFRVFEYDTPRQRLLEQRGYIKTPDGDVSRRLRFGNRLIPQPIFALGYMIRDTRYSNPSDSQRVADLLNAAFNRDFHLGAEVLNFTKNSPSFRHDLDLVAEAPDGSFAAYVGLTYEPKNRYGVLEPVCTHPYHQRKGLARGLILEGLRRIRALGATDVYVGTGLGMAANALYEACGFDEAYTGYIWRKVF